MELLWRCPPRDEAGMWINRILGAKKPVVIYGTGNGADKLLAVLEERGFAPAGIFVSEGFAAGRMFHGLRTETYGEICARLDDFIVVPAFGSDRPEVLARFYALARERELIFPDLPLFGAREVYDESFLRAHAGELEEAYAMLADEASRRVFDAVVSFRRGGDIRALAGCATPRSEALLGVLGLASDERCLDAGAYDGDTIRELISLTGGFAAMTAIEPARVNYAKLLAYIERAGLQNVRAERLAVWDRRGVAALSAKSGRSVSVTEGGRDEAPSAAIDDILAGAEISYIKLDVEGAEARAIAGMKSTLLRQAPKLAISAYHRAEDIFALPRLLREIRADYEIFMRKHESLPAWDIYLYCRARRQENER